jgi:hypothetical protein
MTKEQRTKIRASIVEALEEITADQSCRESVVSLGGHTISYRLLYAGGSQWTGCGREWEVAESGWAWVVDGTYRLTVPTSLFGFDGRNIIERQTGYYLQDGYDTQTTPEHDGRDEIDRVPGRILIEIARGIVAARSDAAAAKAAEEKDADAVLAALCAAMT